jgi:O-antigen biosynthesis protein WbqP
MFNRVIGGVILAVISPILLITAMCILAFDRAPILFKQKRVGKNNELFWIYKFRTMKNNIPDIPTNQVIDPSKLHSNCGPLLRKFSIDELPQLINILKGDMVFIGPRPALYNQQDLITLRTKAGVHELIPGITGWAQVNGRDEISISEKVVLDSYYLKNQSQVLNIKILFMTILKVVGTRGVAH